MAQPSKSKYYCFRVSNPRFVESDDVETDMSVFPVEWDVPWRYWEDVTFVIWSWEISASGLSHIQGYMELYAPERFTALKRHPGLEGAHFEMRRGTQVEAINYCEKPAHPDLYSAEDIATHREGPFMWGEPSEQRQGKAKTERSALFVNKIKDGATDRQLAEEMPGLFLIHLNKVPTVRAVFKNADRGPRRTMPIVLLLVGHPGTGKSRTASLISDFVGSVYRVSDARGSGLYWDGYAQQDVVIIDDMDGSRCKPGFFKQLCDRYPFSVAPLGKPNVEFNSPLIIITSNSVIRQWWPKAMASPSELNAIKRRITHCMFYGWGRKAQPCAQGAVHGLELLAAHGLIPL